MIKNLNFYNVSKIKAPYPIAKIDHFIDKKSCKILCTEIDKFSDFDDLVMNGRFRVNKGSNNFKKYLKNSPYLFSLFKKLNNKKTFLYMNSLLNKKKEDYIWYNEIKDYNFSENNFSEQSFNIFKNLRRSGIISNFITPNIFLDMDFSKSKKGYFRTAHRDRDTRIISFLIYLNTISKKDGGQFQVFDLKKKTEILQRFPNPKSVIEKKNFSPKSGQLFFFLSSPNSYHGVKKFLSKTKNRIFIYGSFTMDRKVNWKIKKDN